MQRQRLKKSEKRSYAGIIRIRFKGSEKIRLSLLKHPVVNIMSLTKPFYGLQHIFQVVDTHGLEPTTLRV